MKEEITEGYGFLFEKELIEEIVFELERNPDLIDFSFADKGLIELDDKVYEKMIPDPNFRQKWLALMKIIN